MSKGLPYGEILKLEEGQIRETFPLGAFQEDAPKDRFRPAEEGEEATVSLKRLLKRKKELIEKRRLLAKHGYTESSFMALRSPDERTKSDPPEPEAVDEATQERFAREAEAEDAARKAQTPLSDRLAKLEGRLRPEQYASIRTRIERLERAAQEKAA